MKLFKPSSRESQLEFILSIRGWGKAERMPVSLNRKINGSCKAGKGSSVQQVGRRGLHPRTSCSGSGHARVRPSGPTTLAAGSPAGAGGGCASHVAIADPPPLIPPSCLQASQSRILPAATRCLFPAASQPPGQAISF